jgi:O-antigen/teichoic acid export membrane protein
MNRKERNSQFFNADLIRNDLRERSVRGGMLTVSCQAIESVLRIGSIAILARMLLPEYFGLIGMVTAITVIAEQFKDLGLSTATVQQKEITHEQVSNLFWVNAALGLALMVLISSASFLIARFYGEQRLIYITIAMSTGFFWSSMTTQHQALLKRQLKLATIGVIQIGSTLISTAIAITMAIKGYGYWALVWLEVLRSLLVALGTWVCCPWIPDPPRKHIKIDRLLRFGRDIAGFNIIVSFAATLDQILIGKFYGPAQLGIYRQAYALIFFPIRQLIQPVGIVTEPSLSFLQDDAERYRRYYRKMLATLSFVTMPVVLYLLVYSRDVVLVVLGERWTETTPIFRILAIAAFISPASHTTLWLLVTCGKTRRFFNLGLVTGLVMLVSFSVGVLWGALGVAYGYLVATYALLVLRLVYSFEGTPVDVRTFFKAIQKPLTASLAMMIVLFVLKIVIVTRISLVQIATSLPIAVLTYLLAWMIISGGKEALREIMSDLMKPLHLDQYIVGLWKGNKSSLNAELP